ncbi:ATP-binding cassette domain-containing protein [Roseibium sp.]|uniref:ATP-binding cassette domain-containing protein n=1 Tax=Roseibium sp. TaxID=1936156 RepID=UPI003A9882DA
MSQTPMPPHANTSSGLDLNAVHLQVEGKSLLTIDHVIAEQETLTVMGPSGSGKSSLLNLIAGFLPTSFTVTGDVRLAGRSLLGLPPQARHVGILFQSPLLFPHLSVGENLLVGLRSEALATGSWKLRRERLAARRTTAEQALASVGLDGFFGRDPATLSGGQQTRAALMRLLLSQPKALLLDEPFSSLDTALRGEIRSLTFERAKAANLPVLLVTHDLEDAEAAQGPVIDLGR